ncbi:MAG TPA: DoxX family protein [Pyrinomonadaceae bacterium]
MASRKAIWIGRILSILAALPFFPSAAFKFIDGPEVTEGFAHLGLPERTMLPLGILEVACVVIYLIPPTSVLGAILLTGYLGGTIITHWRVGEPPIMQIIMGILIWLGLYLRDDRLRTLIPIWRS